MRRYLRVAACIGLSGPANCVTKWSRYSGSGGQPFAPAKPRLFERAIKPLSERRRRKTKRMLLFSPSQRSPAARDFFLWLPAI